MHKFISAIFPCCRSMYAHITYVYFIFCCGLTLCFQILFCCCWPNNIRQSNDESVREYIVGENDRLPMVGGDDLDIFFLLCSFYMSIIYFILFFARSFITFYLYSAPFLFVHGTRASIFIDMCIVYVYDILHIRCRTKQKKYSERHINGCSSVGKYTSIYDSQHSEQSINIYTYI